MHSYIMKSQIKNNQLSHDNENEKQKCPAVEGYLNKT